MQKILTNPTANAKINKSTKKGFWTYGIHLAPAKLSGHNVCAWASKGCASACLNTAGRGRMTPIQESRIKKTRWFYNERENFMLQLVKEIGNAIKLAIKKSQTPCFRLNLTSDLAWESQKFNGVKLMEIFPDVQFYDYTKSVRRMERYLAGKFPPNYHLTFSRSECNDNDLISCYLAGQLCYMGLGGYLDQLCALSTFEKSCIGGVIQSCTQLGKIYKDGRFVAKDKQVSDRYLEAACKAGDSTACQALQP